MSGDPTPKQENKLEEPVPIGSRSISSLAGSIVENVLENIAEKAPEAIKKIGEQKKEKGSSKAFSGKEYAKRNQVRKAQKLARRKNRK